MTLLGSISKISNAETLKSELQQLKTKCQRPNNFLDVMLLFVAEACSSSLHGGQAGMNSLLTTFRLKHFYSSTSFLMSMALSDDIKNQMDFKDGVVSVKIDKRLCTITDIGFRTSRYQYFYIFQIYLNFNILDHQPPNLPFIYKGRHVISDASLKAQKIKS